MAADSNNNNITRTADVAEVEIYLNTTALNKTINQYAHLLRELDNWSAAIDEHNQGIQNNTSGNTTNAFAKEYENFKQGHFEVLYDNTVTAIDIMREDASVEAKKLLVQCENFYEIVVGNAINVGDNNISTLTPILYLDATNYESGTIEAHTTNAMFQLNNIDVENESLVGVLSGLNYKEYLDDCSADIENIRVDCNKNDRLKELFEAFAEYVKGVRKFNDHIATRFDKITLPGAAFDYTRSYEYPYVTDDNEKAILDRVIRGELHEMGLTDEMIDNATKKSSFTLNSLAAAMEEIIAEDRAEDSCGKEVELFKNVLIGEADYREAAGGKFGSGLTDKAEKGWIYIAKYQMGLVHTELNGKRKLSSDGDYELYLAEMNKILDLEYPDMIQVLGALEKGANAVALESYSLYVLMDACYGKEIAAPQLEVCTKDMLLWDSYGFLKDKVVADHNANKVKYILGDLGQKYKIDSMDYKNGGFSFEMSRDFYDRNTRPDPYENILRQYSPFDPRTEKFTLTVSKEVGVGNISMVANDGKLDKALADAYNEQQDRILELVKDGTIMISDVACPGSGSLVGEGIDILYQVSEGEISSDTINSYVDKASSSYMDYYYKTCGIDDDWKEQKEIAATRYGSNVQFIRELNALATSTSIEDAKAAKEAENFAQLAGSAGKCEIKVGDDVVATYANPHVGFVEPHYAEMFEELKQAPEQQYVGSDGNTHYEYHGLAKAGGWSDETVKQLDNERHRQEMEQYNKLNNMTEGTKEYNDQLDKIKETKDNHRIEKQLIEGGYTIDENTSYSELKERLTAINTDYYNSQEISSGQGDNGKIFDIWSGN